MSWRALVHSIFGDNNKGWQREFRCPYFLCPSNQPFVGAFPPKIKFVQKLGPSVYQYKCLHCSCCSNVSVEANTDGTETWKINPAFMGKKPSYQWRMPWKYS